MPRSSRGVSECLRVFLGIHSPWRTRFMLRSAITCAGVLPILVLPAFTAGCKATTPATATVPAAGAAAVVLPTGNPHPGFCPVMGEPVDMAKAEATPEMQSDYEGKKY